MSKGLIAGWGINDSTHVVKKGIRILLPSGKIQQKVVWECPYYSLWKSVITRSKGVRPRPCYVNAEVGMCWKYFTSFERWASHQGFGENNRNYLHLDKDILYPENKLYSEDTCCFVPRYINNLFLDKPSQREGLPLGTSLTESGKYYSQIVVDFKKICSRPEPDILSAHKFWQKLKYQDALNRISQWERESKSMNIIHRQDVFNALYIRAEKIKIALDSDQMIFKI